MNEEMPLEIDFSKATRGRHHIPVYWFSVKMRREST